MGRKPTERTTPDLFSATTVRDALAPSKLPAAETKTETVPQQYILPKDLHAAVKHLSDAELDLLHAATLEEMRRRSKMPRGAETDLNYLRRRFAPPDLMKRQSRPTKKGPSVGIAEVPLTRGQVLAVRAAFKAGITPSRIARQFGISQSNVRKALASDELKR
jgi:hypothetical protein